MGDQCYSLANPAQNVSSQPGGLAVGGQTCWLHETPQHFGRYVFQSYMFVYINYIDPQWVDTVAERWTQMLKDADISDEQISKRITIFRKAWEPLSMFTTELILYGIPQFVLGMIVSLFYIFRNPRKTAGLDSVN